MKNVADYYNKTATGWSDEWLKEKKQSAILEKFYNCLKDNDIYGCQQHMPLAGILIGD